MEIVRGKKTLTINSCGFRDVLSGYELVHIDLGTGDGRYIRHMANKYPGHLFLGIDACRDNLAENSRKAPGNALFIIANAYNLPRELAGIAAYLTINFPWGSLLNGLVHGADALIAGLRTVSRSGTTLEVSLNGGALSEAGFSLEAGVRSISKVLQACGFTMGKPVVAGVDELHTFPTTWAKRIAFGRDPQAQILKGKRI